MGDLTQALIDLGMAEKGRARSRSTLRDATTTVAGAILERLRTGDTVTVDEAGSPAMKVVYRAGRIRWQVSQWANWEDHWGWSDPATTLLRNDAALIDVREADMDSRSNILHVVGSRIRLDDGHAFAFQDDEDEDGAAGHLATDTERLAFAREAPSVITAFAELLGREDRAFSDAAETIARLTPR
jgi:hypothetical protein